MGGLSENYSAALCGLGKVGDGDLSTKICFLSKPSSKAGTQLSGLGGSRPGPEEGAVPQCWSVIRIAAGVPGSESWPEGEVQEKK